ncbi:trihelix transcription factor ASIL1-like [Phoenix dactylifera]|uniref:Trihelix transcription factor ASIL1-like n=1 Tax=Phoenix dactylifera TaxID=42345 RepID=A0A8B9A982_PHODC|nr:trihelix transcription factor ASIL1-like [Phoenix dactylifera]
MTGSGVVERHTRPPALAAAAAAARKPAPGQPWSHLETVHLIEAYEEKWYSLKRGQLKAHQWEEVAAALAARCGFDGLSKNGTQCRHKIEKLRKRYRAERLRPNPSAWPYFDRMDRMERGPLPISVRPPVSPAAAAAAAVGEPSSEEDEDEEDEEEERMASNTRSINGILREGNWGFSRVSRNPRSRKRRAFEEEEEEDDDDDEEEEEEGMGGRGEALSQLAVVVRMFGEELVRMEKRRMEVLRQVKRDWMEMEAKRAEMVMESQQCLVDTIANAFSSLKKAKKSQDS